MSIVETGTFVNALTAHREWATRPADERYQSLPALYAAARQMRAAAVEVKTAAEAIVVDVDDTRDEILIGADGVTGATMTTWAFQQLCHDVQAPSDYLRTLPAPVAADCLRVGLDRLPSHRLLFVDQARNAVRAFTSQRYSRLHCDEVAGQLLTLQERHPEWALPMGYKDGVWGAPLVPSGAYLSDRDMFVMLIDGNRAIDDPTDATDQGLFRGVILRNSDVGAAALTLDFFYFRRVCGNNIIWGFEHAVGLRRRHVGLVADSLDAALVTVESRLLASAVEDEAIIQRAQTRLLGATKADVLGTLGTFLSKKTADAAYDLAERHEPNPHSVWGAVQGLTWLSQQTPFANVRHEADRAASQILQLAA